MQKNSGGFSSEIMDSALLKGVRKNGLPFAIGGVCKKEGICYEGFSCNESLCGPVDMDTILWLASMTKAVTSVAVMQLVEQGMLSLEQKAGEILPELFRLSVLEGYDEEGNAVLTSCESAVTIRQLLNHTSGFAYSFWDPLIDRYYSENKLPDTTSGRLSCLSVPLVRQPGTAWEYGISTDWLGLILEKLTGIRLGEYFRKYIFAPLKMHDTGFKVADMKRLAPFYQLASEDVSVMGFVKNGDFAF